MYRTILKYLGGANKAERLAQEKQESKRNDSYHLIMRHIEVLNLENSIN